MSKEENESISERFANFKMYETAMKKLRNHILRLDFGCNEVSFSYSGKCLTVTDSDGDQSDLHEEAWEPMYELLGSLLGRDCKEEGHLVPGEFSPVKGGRK